MGPMLRRQVEGTEIAIFNLLYNRRGRSAVARTAVAIRSELLNRSPFCARDDAVLYHIYDADRPANELLPRHAAHFFAENSLLTVQAREDVMLTFFDEGPDHEWGEILSAGIAVCDLLAQPANVTSGV